MQSRRDKMIDCDNDLGGQLAELPEVDPPLGLAAAITGKLPDKKVSFWRRWRYWIQRPVQISFVPVKWAPVLVALLLAAVFMQVHPRPSETFAPGRQEGELSYILGRNHLAQDQPDEAMPLLKKAVALDPGNAGYHFWLGVAQWSSDNQSGERQSYLAALDLDPTYLPARVYLGHNYFDHGAWQQALSQYERVLQTVPDHREALFNSALAYRRLGQTSKENATWATFLSHYGSGTRAMHALSYLNTNGDYSFQAAIVGKEQLAMRQVAFHGGGSQLTKAAEASVLTMGNKFAQRDNLILHVVVFSKGDAALAKKRAKAIKQTMLDAFPGIPRERIRLSWFDSALAQKINGREHLLSESVRFFTEPAI